jgi:amino acid transporter
VRSISGLTGGAKPPGQGFKARAGLLSVVGLLFASTCAGPYGMEDFVSGVGPGLFVTLLFVTPWLWGLPYAFASAELSSRMSVEGGYYRWARAYMGEFWGFQAGIFSVLSSFLDNALYPVLFARALAFVVPDMSRLEMWLAAAAFIIVLTWINYRGIVLTGATAVALNVFLMAPMVWIIIASVGRVKFHPFVPFRVSGADFASDLGGALALALWLYSGYGEVSTVGEEVARPRRNIPLGLLIVTPLTILSYSLPVIAALAAVGGWEHWSSGEFAAIGSELGGPMLGRWAFLGTVASHGVVFLTYLLWMSRIAWSMSADKSLPSWLSRVHPKYGTPYRVLWLYAAVYCLMATLPFEALVHFTVLKARQQSPPKPGSFRVPGGTLGLWLNVLVPGATWTVFLALTAREHAVFGVPLLLAGPLIWGMVQYLKRWNPAVPAH